MMEHKFIQQAKIIVDTLESRQDAGADYKSNIDCIAQYLEQQQLLNKACVIGCKEMLVQMMNKEQEMAIAQEYGFEVANEHFIKFKSVQSVLKMIDELPAL